MNCKLVFFGEGQQTNEGQSISKKDLREVQGHYAPRCGACDLREREAQAAPGLTEPGSSGSTELRTSNYELFKEAS